jgi:hypothetical protein
MPERKRARTGGAARAGRAGKKAETGPDLKDLGKAGEHFIAGATELVAGTGFVIRGVKHLLENEEGRKFLCELPMKAVNTGIELVKKAGNEVKERRKAGAGQKRGSRSRKINVE